MNDLYPKNLMSRKQWEKAIRNRDVFIIRTSCPPTRQSVGEKQPAEAVTGPVWATHFLAQRETSLT